MKIRFVIAGQGIMEGVDTLIAEVDVTKKPTKKEVDAIYEYINERVEKWYDEDTDISDRDYAKVCRAACKKYLQTKRNQVVHTFYI